MIFDISKITKIAVFASGSGSNAENLVRYFDRHTTISVSLILSDRASAYVLQRAANLSVESAVFPRAQFTQEDADNPVAAYLKTHDIDLVILAGFLGKIPKVLIQQYPDKIINIHPALLPKYGGKGMYGSRVHQAVIAAKEPVSGITIHLVNEVYDDGRILFQVRCDVATEDSPEDLAKKIHSLEHAHFPQVVENYVNENS